jgi:hypothetical protein
VDILVTNGLLQDVQVISEELKLERPSAATRMRLLEWVNQLEASAEAVDSSSEG